MSQALIQGAHVKADKRRACSSWRLAIWCSINRATPGPRQRHSQPDATLVKLSRPLCVASLANSLSTPNKPIVLHRDEVKQRELWQGEIVTTNSIQD